MIALVSEEVAYLCIHERLHGIGYPCRELEMQHDTVWSSPVPERVAAYVWLGNTLLQIVTCS